MSLYKIIFWLNVLLPKAIIIPKPRNRTKNYKPSTNYKHINYNLLNKKNKIIANHPIVKKTRRSSLSTILNITRKITRKCYRFAQNICSIYALCAKTPFTIQTLFCCYNFTIQQTWAYHVRSPIPLGGNIAFRMGPCPTLRGVQSGEFLLYIVANFVQMHSISAVER